MTIKIRAKWVILGLFLLIEGLLVVLFNFRGSDDRGTIAFAATVLGGAFALFTYLEGLDEKRSKHAHHLMERWNSAEPETKRVLLEVREHRLDPATLTRDSDDLKTQRSAIVSVLNFFEEVAIAVFKDTASEDHLKEFFGAIVQQTFAKLEDWIKNERKLDNEPAYYTQFEKLAANWKSAK